MKLIIICIICLSFLIKIYFQFVQVRFFKKSKLNDIEDSYSEGVFEKSKSFTIMMNNLDQIITTINFFVILGFLLFNVPNLILRSVKNSFSNSVSAEVITALIIALVFLTIEIIKSSIQTFFIDKKFNFNKSSVMNFILDWLIKVVLMLAVLSFFVAAYSSNSAIGKFGALLLAMVVAFVFRKIFYHSIPMAESELKDKIKEFAKEYKYKFKNVYVMNASKRSSRVNAFIYGNGKRRKIVLYDTLINTFSVDEIIAVFAHEMGHAKHKDRLKQLIVFIPLVFIFLLLFKFINQSMELAQAFGYSELNIDLTIFIIYSFNVILIFFTSIIKNSISRYFEYKADEFASRTAGKENILKALKHLAISNLSNVYPHPIEEFIYYTHPSVLKRITAIQNIENEGSRASD